MVLEVTSLSLSKTYDGAKAGVSSAPFSVLSKQLDVPSSKLEGWSCGGDRTPLIYLKGQLLSDILEATHNNPG